MPMRIGKLHFGTANMTLLLESQELAAEGSEERRTRGPVKRAANKGRIKYSYPRTLHTLLTLGTPGYLQLVADFHLSGSTSFRVKPLL